MAAPAALKKVLHHLSLSASRAEGPGKSFRCRGRGKVGGWVKYMVILVNGNKSTMGRKSGGS